MAFDAGLSSRHYQQLESGEANPTFATVLEIARVLDLTVVDLITPLSRIKPKRRRASKNEPQRKSKT